MLDISPTKTVRYTYPHYSARNRLRPARNVDMTAPMDIPLAQTGISSNTKISTYITMYQHIYIFNYLYIYIYIYTIIYNIYIHQLYLRYIFPSFLLLSTTSRPRHQGSSRFHLSKCDQSCHQDSAWSVLRSFPWWIYQQIKHQLETDPSCLKMMGTQAKSSCFIIIWWYTYPSEKYESQMGLLFPIYGKS